MSSMPVDGASFDLWHVGDLTRESRFAEAIAYLKSGACDAFSEEDWASQDAARSRTPIILICDSQYDLADANPNSRANELIEALIAAGCPVDAIDDYGNCALNYAAGGGDAAKTGLLLAAGADPNLAGTEWPPLLSALASRMEGSAAALWSLLAAGGDLDLASVDFDDQPRQSARSAALELKARGEGVENLEAAQAFEDWKALRAVSPEPGGRSERGLRL